MAISFTETTSKRDPYRNFNFRIYFEESTTPVLGCRKMSGLVGSVEPVKFRAGHDASSVDMVMPGRVSYEPLTFENGITDSTTFRTWANQLIQHHNSTAHRRTDPEFRRNIRVEVYDVDNQTIVLQYTVYACWVSKYTALPEIDATSNEVLIETLELQHEGFSEVSRQSA